MKLNTDCLIDVLLTVEERTGVCKYWCVRMDSCDELPVYTAEEVYYHVKQAQSAGLIDVSVEFIDGSIEISDLTMRGHLALDSVRKPSIRQNAKREWTSRVLNGIAEASINGFFAVAWEIAKNEILG